MEDLWLPGSPTPVHCNEDGILEATGVFLELCCTCLSADSHRVARHLTSLGARLNNYLLFIDD